MYPTSTHELTHIRQAEYRRQADEHRLAKAAKVDDTHEHAEHVHGTGLMSAIASLLRPLRAPKASAV